MVLTKKKSDGRMVGIVLTKKGIKDFCPKNKYKLVILYKSSTVLTKKNVLHI